MLHNNIYNWPIYYVKGVFHIYDLVVGGFHLVRFL